MGSAHARYRLTPASPLPCTWLEYGPPQPQCIPEWTACIALTTTQQNHTPKTGLDLIHQKQSAYDIYIYYIYIIQSNIHESIWYTAWSIGDFAYTPHLRPPAGWGSFHGVLEGQGLDCQCRTCIWRFSGDIPKESNGWALNLQPILAGVYICHHHVTVKRNSNPVQNLPWGAKRVLWTTYGWWIIALLTLL